MSEEEESGAVWIQSEPSVDGKTYVVTLEVDDDTAITFTPDRAMEYARGVLEAAHRAAYDAAVFQQITKKLRLDQQTAGQLVVDLRADRPSLSGESTAPISFDPGVAARDHSPFLAISIRGERVGQWTVEDARQHALRVLETIIVADLDAGYFRALTGAVGIDASRARQAVADIANHRV